VEVKIRVFLTALIGGSELVYAPAVLPLVPLIFQTLVVILYKSQGLTVQNSTFCAQNVLAYLVCTQNKQLLFPYTTVTGFCNRDGVCLLRGMFWISTYNTS